MVTGRLHGCLALPRSPSAICQRGNAKSGLMRGRQPPSPAFWFSNALRCCRRCDSIQKTATKRMSGSQPSTSVVGYGWVGRPCKAGLRPPPPAAADGLDRACPSLRLPPSVRWRRATEARANGMPFLFTTPHSVSILAAVHNNEAMRPIAPPASVLRGGNGMSRGAARRWHREGVARLPLRRGSRHVERQCPPPSSWPSWQRLSAATAARRPPLISPAG
jgi:hypothetical protein